MLNGGRKLRAKDQLKTLLRIQELAVASRKANQLLENAPRRIEEIEANFRERNTEYVAVRDRHDELEKDQRIRSAELTTLEEQRQKYMEDLMQVKNQREYSAMLKEIDSVKAQISEHEDAIIKDMEEIEKVTAELETHGEHIKIEREKVGEERAHVEAEAEAARNEVRKLGEERSQLESQLPNGILITVRQLEATRQGIFLTQADNGTCLSCFVRVRPQVFQEIKLASKIHSCSSCRRFLYFEPVLRTNPASAEPNVEAVNGGAV